VILPWPFGGYSDAVLLDHARLLDHASGVADRHLAEVAALTRLLGRRRFGCAVYVGGRHDRFSQVLRDCADRVTVAAPGPLDVEDASMDLAVMVSALQERPYPAGDFAEIARVLRPGGLSVIAAPSVLHGPGRHRYRRSPQAMTGSPAVTGGRLGHHPETLMLQLAVCGLRVERLLPVYGLRHPVLGRMLAGPALRGAQYAVRARLIPGHFGPVVFFLARKSDLT
jgi:SAM-dependent methyltransferase